MDILSPVLDGAEACLFDLDGVLTPTVDVHRKAWAQVFRTALAGRADVLPYNDSDYYGLVDGRPRYEAVREVLLSRDINLPEGDPSDQPSMATVCAMGNLKDSLFLANLARQPLVPYPGSVAFLSAAVATGLLVAVVSASRNARYVLKSAGLLEQFDVVIDGIVTAELGLGGKPAPDTYTEATRRLGVTPSKAIIVEDALSGVEAGRAGKFGCVIGVNRGSGAQALMDHGASIVVDDLQELVTQWPMIDLNRVKQDVDDITTTPIATATGAGRGPDLAATDMPHVDPKVEPVGTDTPSADLGMESLGKTIPRARPGVDSGTTNKPPTDPDHDLGSLPKLSARLGLDTSRTARPSSDLDASSDNIITSDSAEILDLVSTDPHGTALGFA